MLGGALTRNLNRLPVLKACLFISAERTLVFAVRPNDAFLDRFVGKNGRAQKLAQDLRADPAPDMGFMSDKQVNTGGAALRGDVTSIVGVVGNPISLDVANRQAVPLL